MLAGPFKINPNTKNVLVFTKPDLFYKVPIVITPRHCTDKQKRLQSKGRRVSNVTKSGINDLYAPHESRTNLPTLRYIMALCNGASHLVDFDYAAAYRQMPYDCRCWGLISYNYNGHIFIDLSGTFGLCIMSRKQQEWASDMLDSFKIKYKEEFSPDNLKFLNSHLRSKFLQPITNLQILK